MPRPLARAAALALALPLASPSALGAKASDEVVSVLEALSDEQHECQPVIPQLDARIAAEPRDLSARLARGECLYRVGRMEQAQADLAVAFEGDAPDKVAFGLRRSLSSDATAFTRVLDAWTLHGVLAAHLGDLARAQDVAGELPSLEAVARQHVGLPEVGARHLRVQAHLAHARGDRARAWSLVDRLLAEHPEDPHSKLAATELASLDPDHVSQAAMTLISAPARSNRAYNRAVAALNAGQWSQCLAELDALLPEQRGPSLRRFQELAYPCAVQAGDLVRAADLARALGSIPAERTDAVLAHAEKLQQAGRDDEAAGLLGVVRPRNAEEQAVRATLLVRIHTKAGRLDEAVAAAGEGAVRPATLANLALALKQAERLEEARAVLAPACPAMSGQDAVRCFDLLERLGG